MELGNQLWQSVLVCSQLPVGLRCTLCCSNCETWACHETILYSQNKEICHALGEVQKNAVLKKEAKVCFCPVFAKCIYTWRTWLPLVQTSLGRISHLSWSHAKNPWRFHPHPWNGMSLCLLQLSAWLLLKRQRGEEKMQTRCFLAFHIKSCSHQDHKCLRWQRERDSVSP